MTDIEYRPIAHNHEEFLENAFKRKGFAEAYQELADEHALVRELLADQSMAVLTR